MSSITIGYICFDESPCAQHCQKEHRTDCACKRAEKNVHCLRLIVSDAAEIIAAPDGEPPNRPSVKTRGTEGILLFFKREDSVCRAPYREKDSAQCRVPKQRALHGQILLQDPEKRRISGSHRQSSQCSHPFIASKALYAINLSNMSAKAKFFRKTTKKRTSPVACTSASF